jgi:XTP/dITP diphosphohydrolase
MEIVFVTTNKGKMGEAIEIGREFGIEFIPNDYDTIEIQSHDTKEIAIESAKDAYDKIKQPLIVEDSGLFIEALNGFPGTYSAYVFKTIGLDGVMKTMQDVPDRKAVMKSAVAYTDGNEVKSFLGEVSGVIPDNEKGLNGFGYDPIFIPDGNDKTFGEDTEFKSKVSHRARSLRKFCEWYSKQ